MNFAFEIHRESNPRVVGTFGTNRIYTVGRVVKVEDLMRFGGWLRAGSIPPVSQMQIHQIVLAVVIFSGLFVL